MVWNADGSLEYAFGPRRRRVQGCLILVMLGQKIQEPLFSLAVARNSGTVSISHVSPPTGNPCPPTISLITPVPCCWFQLVRNVPTPSEEQRTEWVPGIQPRVATTHASSFQSKRGPGLSL